MLEYGDEVGPYSFDRRTFLTAASATVALAACGAGAPQPRELRLRFPDGLRAPSVAVAGSPQRFPFVIGGDDGFPMTDQDAPAELILELSFRGEMIDTHTIPARGIGQFTPYYPLVFTPEAAGPYSVRAEFSEFDTEFLVVERDQTPLFQIGENLPLFVTPTFDDAAGVNPVCTRPGEPCAFHEITLTDAIDNDRPTAMLIATPQFCQTDVCGPNLEWLIDLASNRTDINVIHAEVFEDFLRDSSGVDIPVRAPMLLEWDLAFEPSLFILDAEGVIVDARHFAFDRGEMEEALALI